MNILDIHEWIIFWRNNLDIFYCILNWIIFVDRFNEKKRISKMYRPGLNGKEHVIITLKSDKILDFEKIILKCIPTYIPADIFLSNLKSLMSFYLIFKWRGKIHWTKSRIELRSPGLILNLNLTWTHHCIVGKGTWKFLHDIDNSNFSRDVCLIMFFYWSCLSRKRFC